MMSIATFLFFAKESIASDFDRHVDMAQAFRAKGQYSLAEQEYKSAHLINSGNLQVLMNLGYVSYLLGHLSEAQESFEKMLKINPICLPALGNLGRVYMSKKEYGQAKNIYEEFIKLSPSDPIAQFNLSLVYLITGNLAVGLEKFDKWKRVINNETKRSFSQPEWNISAGNLRGKSILVYVEKEQEGFGDVFQFIRYAKKLKSCGAKVIVVVSKPMVKILLLCGYIDQVVTDFDSAQHFDYQIELGDLPGAFNTTIESVPAEIPYIFAKDELVDHWRKALSEDTNFKIGLCWQGSSPQGSEFEKVVAGKRSFPVELFSMLSNTKNVSFYSLQREHQDGVHVGELFINGFGSDFDKSHGAFMDTAAIMKNLDLVISVDTSVAHLAGALGVPTWLILSYESNWRWLLDRNDSPWYPTVRIFRQKERDIKEQVFEDILSELSKVSYKAHQK